MSKLLFGPLMLPGILSGAASSGAVSLNLFPGLLFSTTQVIGGAGGSESWAPSGSSAPYLGMLSRQSGTFYHMFYNSTTAPTANKFLAGGPSGSTRLNIYTGARPSIASLTNLSSHSSNLLISFPIPAYSTTRSATGMYFDTSSVSSTANVSDSVDYTGMIAYLGICPTFTAASVAGVATWFWFGNYASPTNLSGKSFVTGSVGLVGSNSDLEMVDTTITSGSLYKSMGFKFYIPSGYSD